MAKVTDDIFTFDEWEFLQRLLDNPQFNGRPRVERMRPKLAAFMSTLEVAGGMVFEMELPLNLAPSMNVYSSLEGWQRDKLRNSIDWHIVAAVSNWRGSVLPVGAIRKRLVLVTRHSSSRIDEISVDVAGGKAAIDRLVLARVLAGDSAKFLTRRAAWKQAPPGKGSFNVRVFELAKSAGQQVLLG